MTQRSACLHNETSRRRDTVRRKQSTMRESLSKGAQTARRKVNEFLVGIDGSLELDWRGVCRIEDAGLLVVLEVPCNSECLFLYAVVCNLDQSRNSAALMKRALKLNYMQQHTRGACLSLDGDDEITLSFTQRVADIDSHQFLNIIDNFIDTTFDMRIEFDTYRSELEGRPVSTPAA